MEENRTNIKVYYRNELLCTLYDEDFEENSLEVSGSALGSSGFNIGGATSNQSSLTLTKVGLKKMRENNALRRKARFDIETFEGINNSAGYKYNLGKFYVTELTVGDYSADLVLYDGMVSFDDKISEEDLKVVQTTENTIVGWVNWVMSKCSSPFYQITLDTSTINTDMPNGGILFKITDDSRIDTYRNMLELLSVLAGGYFKIDRYGKLYYGNFKNIETGRFINETVVTDYNEDAYPCFVRKLKTSVAGFDHAVGNTNVPEGHDELELAVYENPFLRSKVTEEDKYLPAEVQGIINTMSSPVVGKKLTGGSVSYMSGYGKLGHLSELIEVRRNVIPYGGESATQLLTSKLLVTDFTYQYKNSITLKCNASVANINPSSSGLNKGVGYKPMDRRLDTIADRLQENKESSHINIDTKIDIEGDMLSVYKGLDKRNGDGIFATLLDEQLPDYNENPSADDIIEVDISDLHIIRHLDTSISIEDIARCSALEDTYVKEIKGTGGVISLNNLDYIILLEVLNEDGGIIHYERSYIHTTDKEHQLLVEIPTDYGSTVNHDFGPFATGAIFSNPLVGVPTETKSEKAVSAYYNLYKYKLGSTLKSEFTSTAIQGLTKIKFDIPATSNAKRVRISLCNGNVKNANDFNNTIFTFGVLYDLTAYILRDIKPYGEFYEVYSPFSETCFKNVLDTSTVRLYGNIKIKSENQYNEVRSTIADKKDTVDIIVDEIKSHASMSDVTEFNNNVKELLNSVIALSNRLDNIDADYLHSEIEKIRNSINSILERLNKLEQGTTPPDITDTLSKIEESLKKLESDLGVTNNKLDNHIKSSDISISSINRSISELNERVKKLENSGIKPPEPQEPTTSTGVNVAYYYNSSLVGVSQGKTEFAKLKLDLNNGVVPVLNVSANASVVQNGTLTFEVLLDGSKMPLNPKFLLSKATEFISFSLPFLEISEGKLYDLSLLCSTEDSEVNFNPNDIAISVINAKLAKSATSFDEKVKPFTISSSNIKLSTITENISTTK